MPLRTLLFACGLAFPVSSGRSRIQAAHPDPSRRPAERVVELARRATTRVRLEP